MKWYRLLLLAYPRSFRERFGRDLEEIMRANVPGRQAAVARLLVAVLLDDHGDVPITLTPTRQAFTVRAGARNLGGATVFSVPPALNEYDANDRSRV